MFEPVDANEEEGQEQPEIETALQVQNIGSEMTQPRTSHSKIYVYYNGGQTKTWYIGEPSVEHIQLEVSRN